MTRLHLYRPLLWWDGEAARLRACASAFTPAEAAHLLYRRHATFTPGDPMGDDNSSALKLVTAPVAEPLTLRN